MELMRSKPPPCSRWQPLQWLRTSSAPAAAFARLEGPRASPITSVPAIDVKTFPTRIDTALTSWMIFGRFFALPRPRLIEQVMATATARSGRPRQRETDAGVAPAFSSK